MKLELFDEGLDHRKILPYDSAYRELALRVRRFVEAELEGIELIHIGSTAIPDLRGKPMLDFVAITTRVDLRATQREFEKLGFHRRGVWVDRDDKPYVCAATTFSGRRFNLNIHLCHRGDPVHKDSLAFMAILNRRPDLRKRYETAKDHAHAIDPVNPENYNRAKEAIIKEIHAHMEGQDSRVGE